MTIQERVIVSAYTGVLMCDFEYVQEYIEKILGRPVYTHEISNDSVRDEIREKSKKDFLKLCGNGFDFRYDAKEMDRHIKVNLCLIDKFREQLYKEYGKSFSEISDMYEKLYQEQMQKMPLMWYEYCCVSSDNK